MKETLIDIVRSICAWDDTRKGTGITCVARVHCLQDGVEETFWFTIENDYSIYRNSKIRRLGRFVHKNSEIAIKIQTSDIGSSIEYSHPNYINRMQSYCIELLNRSDFQNQTILIADDPVLYRYRDIRDFFEALQHNHDSIIDVEDEIAELEKMKELLNKNDVHQRVRITDTINELKEKYRILTQQQEELKNITIYIRKQGEMRYSLIVDTKQTKIKSQNLFDGKTIVIDGGPGTGKSTTMIHRLAYLTDTYALKEDQENKLGHYKLNSSCRKQLFQAIKDHRDWMFFSPSPMLREYLAVAMQKEGLKKVSQKVWNWIDFCKYALQDHYQLLDSSFRKAPFTECHISDLLFYQNSGIIQEFTKFYLSQYQQISAQLPTVKTQGLVSERMSIVLNIKKKFEGSENYTLADFISLFQNLETVYGNDCKRILQDFQTILSSFATEICEWMDEHQAVKFDLEDVFKIISDESDDTTDEDGQVNSESSDHLLKHLKKWLKAYCLNQYAPNYTLTEEQMFVCEILQPFMEKGHDALIRKIGEYCLFEYFSKYTKGISAILLSNITKSYKGFRKYLRKVKFKGCNLDVLSKIEARKSAKPLHFQEQALLLGFINNLVKQIKNVTRTPIKHVYVEAYEELARPVIGIDEATDFSVCEIYAMQSLLTSEFNSLTLCGDMMQRLTAHGISSWEELQGIVPNLCIKKLDNSYRQSSKLIQLAKQLYKDTMGETPRYKAYMKSRKVPDPLVFIDPDEHSKILWISKRLEEIYRAYGEQLPSIAIFVTDKGYIPKFRKSLQETSFFSEHRIEVLDGSNMDRKSSENHVCVYPIDIVKGMEFDVVFFHNIDNSYIEETQLMKRLIYVGISRAAFFLAITLSKPNDDIDKYFKKEKDWFNI